MQIQPQLDSERLIVEFENAAELRSFAAEAASQGAVLLELSETPKLLARYRVSLTLPPSFEDEVEGTVVQVFEGPETSSVVLELEALADDWERAVSRRLDGDATPAEDDSEDHSERTGTPPIVRIRQMNVRERMQLAARADRIERGILQRDSSPQVLMLLVTNPRISADDIVQIVRNPQVSPGVIDRIARERRWLTNPEIQKALVKSPKTPSPIALRLVDSLPTRELRQLAKMQSGMRENLRRAALRVYLKRSR
jgi:hypothetical protein